MSTALGLNCCGCEGPGTSVQVGAWGGQVWVPGSLGSGPNAASKLSYGHNG